VTVNPDVDASVRVPCATEMVSESLLVPALASATEIALLFVVEKVSDPFSFREPVAGAVIVGGLAAVTVRPILSESERLSPESASEIASESDPV
jgi:hypothetical protein